MTEMFLIQRKGYVGNSLLWWRKGAAGYTTDIDDAMQVDEVEARSIEANKPDEDIAWPVKLIEAAATRHVTGDNLPSRQSDPAPAPSADGDLPDDVSTTSWDTSKSYADTDDPNIERDLGYRPPHLR